MEPEKNKNVRLTGLDGLRGLAILLVFLTHINAQPIIEVIPPSFHTIVETIFSSGVTGVSILFVLCGFLMAYLYAEPASAFTFLQRRYTRIFPLFLSMATAMAIIRINPALSPIIRIAIIFSIAVSVNLLWRLVQQIRSSKLSRILFSAFIFLQITVGLWYALYIMRRPPVVFNELMPKPIHEATVWLVNATLTLPLGNYIPMLDGVYWSLAAEVLFYVLYPILFVPVFVSFKKSSYVIKAVFAVSLIPFIIGVDQLSHRILGFSMLQFPLFYYFITGISLAHLYRKYQKEPHLFSRLIYPHFLKSFSVVLFFIVIFVVRLNLHTVSPLLNPWLRILWAFPLTLLVFMTIDSSTSLSKMASSKPLVYLGKISYSLYLSHTATIEIMKEFYSPKTAVETIVFIAISFMCAVIVASVLQYLLERPYFMAKREKSVVSYNHVYHKKTLFISIMSLYVITVFIAYQSHFNFFSNEYLYTNEIIKSPVVKENTPIDMNKNRKIILQFQAHENNLGILALHPGYYQLPKKVRAEDNWQKLQVRIKEVGATNWYATSEFSPVQIGDSEMLPFGFPVIADSKDKIYQAELELLNPKSNNSIYLRTSPQVASAISQMNKTSLFKHPNLFAAHVSRRLMNVFHNPEAQMAMVLAIPVFVLLLRMSL